MSVVGLVSALLPVFFVLALGYLAGKRHTFDAVQAAGLSKLALGFALPSALFVSMTDIQRNLLLQQGKLVVSLLFCHVGLFLVALLILGRIPSLKGAGAILFALTLSTSATPVFGIAVLQPLLGDTTAGTVGLVALAINLVVPLAIIFLELDAAKSRPASATSSVSASPVLTGLKTGFRSPLLWAPILGTLVVLLGVHLPKPVASSLEMIGSATSGVAVFTVGLTLAAHSFHMSRTVLLGALGRIAVQTLVLLALFHLLNVSGVFAREALVCCSFPMATIVVLFAAKYRAFEAETASILLLSTVALLAAVPFSMALGRP
jgi:malonate transporter